MSSPNAPTSAGSSQIEVVLPPPSPSPSPRTPDSPSAARAAEIIADKAAVRALIAAGATSSEIYEAGVLRMIKYGELGKALICVGGGNLPDDHPAVREKLLLYAVGRRMLRVASAMLNQKVNPNAATDSYGGTALMFAARYGLEDMTNALLEAGADPNAATLEFRVTALMDCENAAVARALLAHGADPHATDAVGYTALYFAAHDGHEDVVRELLKAGADPFAASERGLTAFDAPRHLTKIHELLRAARGRHVKGVRRWFLKLWK